MKTGRNDPCPCGSGLKYKRCCLVSRAARPTLQSIAATRESEAVPEFDPVGFHEQFMKERRAHLGRYGHVREPLTALSDEHRFVLVGGQVRWYPTTATFTDILLDYVRYSFGKEWWLRETEASDGSCHPVMQWWRHWHQVSKTVEKDARGYPVAEPDARMKALIVLAYDLYVLRGQARLEERVLARLRQADQFRGARYELVVAAMFVRAGFNIKYEDEGDGRTRHPEFVATHDALGIEVDVEARARHRGPAARPTDPADVYRLLNDAVGKRRSRPFVVCLELGLPVEPLAEGEVPPWIPELDETSERLTSEHGGIPPLDLVLFTGLPHQYGEVAQPRYPRPAYAKRPSTSRLPAAVLDVLEVAYEQYGNVPTDFPEKGEPGVR